MRIKKLTFMAVLLSCSLVLGVIEAKIPLFTAVPGGKIGISNIVVLISVYILNPIAAIFTAVLKSLLVSFFAGTPSSFLYGGSGAVLSVLVMLSAKKLLKDRASCIGVSILGALGFNFAQTAVAALVVNNINMFRYLPVLWLISAFSGLATGLAANGIMGALKNV